MAAWRLALEGKKLHKICENKIMVAATDDGTCISLAKSWKDADCYVIFNEFGGSPVGVIENPKNTPSCNGKFHLWSMDQRWLGSWTEIRNALRNV